MPGRIESYSLLGNQEFQTALVRLFMWVIGFSSMWMIYDSGYYSVSIDLFWFGTFFIITGAALLFTSILIWPKMKGRRLFALFFDCFGVGLVISVTDDVINPFFLLFLWISISYGARYGIQYLKWSVLVTMLSYCVSITYIGGWQEHPYEAYLYLLIMAFLPLYLASILHRLHTSKFDAEKANQAKTRFLSTMTHELRTPLSGLSGMGYLLRTTRLDSQQREYVNAIESLAKVLKTLIGDILDISKIEAGKLELENLPFVLRGVVLDVCNSLTGQALKKGLELTCRFEPDVPEVVRGDELRFRQILYNLLGNAVKFTEQGCVQIRICLIQTEALPIQLRVEIEDTGIGIPQEKLGYIFESFQQVDDSTTRRYGGTGLGTTIASELSRLMGGDIGAESQEGKGSLFWVNVPLLPDGFKSELAVFPEHLRGIRALALESSVAGAQMLMAACDDLGVICQQVDNLQDFKRGLKHIDDFDILMIADAPDSALINMAVDTLKTQGFINKTPCVLIQYVGQQLIRAPKGITSCPKPYSSESLAAALLESLWALSPDSYSADYHLQEAQRMTPRVKGGRILVAEDNHLVAKVLVTLLQKQGYKVTWVANGVAALKAAEEEKYHLVLADIRMPEMDGIEFTRQYRLQEPAGQHLPIVALTANAAEEVKEACQTVGMNAFLTKPVEPADLFRIINALI